MRSESRRPSLLLIVGLLALCVGCVREIKTSPNPVAGYELVVMRDNQPAELLFIAADGSGCGAFVGGPTHEVCLVATNLLPDAIGGAAHGRLNELDTPAFIALIWRARIDGNVTVCVQGGLLSPRLEQCRQAAQDPNYLTHGEGLTVSVPIGQ